MAAVTTSNGGESKALFAQVQFYIECSQDLNVDAAESVSRADPVRTASTDMIAVRLQSFWKRMGLSSILVLTPMAMFL